MAPGGMNMSVGLDLSALQKDLKVLDRDLNSKVGQEKILKIKAVIEMDDPKKELDEYTGQIKKVAREGFEPLYRAIKRLQKAQEGLKFNVGGVAYDVNSIKEAQKYMRDLRKEFNAREKNGTMTADWKRQYVDAQAQMSEWVKATRSVTRELGSYGLLDYDKEAGKIKSLRAAYNKELKAIKAEMASLGDVEPRDLKRREELLTRQIALQEKLNATYKRVSPQKQQAVSDLRAERDAIRLKQKQADIQAKINSLEQDRANARSLDRKIDQIRTERVAVGKLVSAYENLANKQRKYGGDPTAAQARAAALRQEHAALKNLEREELNRMKALNQNNSLFNDQGRIIGRLRTLASRYVSIFTIGHLANKIIETTGYFEKQQVALEGIVGSATKAAEIMNQIKAFAPNSPFQTRQLVDYTKRLAAFSIPADKLFSTTKQLADLSAGLGVDMERIILAYGQVNAAAVLRGQELRQFTEAGIPMVDALAKKFSDLNGRLVTTGEVFELISKRQVPFEMVASVLSDMTSEGGKFYRMQENLMNTIYGQREKLKDLWTLSLNDIGTGLGGMINRVLKTLQVAIKNAKFIITGLFWGVLIKSAASAYQSIKLLIVQFRTLGMAASAAWGVIAAAIGIAVGFGKKLWDENHKIEKQFDEIHKTFKRQTDSAIRGLDELIRKFQSTSQGTKAYNDALETLKSNYSQYADVTDEYVASLIREKDVYDNLVDAIKKYNEALEKKQQLEQAKTTMGESFKMGTWNTKLEGYMPTAGIELFGRFEKKYEMGYNYANKAFAETMDDIFKKMRDSNLLSISEDEETRDKENEAAFLKLLPEYMKINGLGEVYKDMTKKGINDLWIDFNRIAFKDNDSRRTYEEYRQLRREELGAGTSDFAWISRIENIFKDLPATLQNALNGESQRNYTLSYNAGWVRAAYSYLIKKKGDFRSLKDEEGNQLAKTEYDALIAGMRRELKEFDDASIANVHELLNNYHDALAKVDHEGAAMLTHLINLFIAGTEEASDRAAAVRSTIFKTWEEGSKELKFAMQYLPTNATYETTREKLPQEHIKRIEDLAKYGIIVEKSETIPTKRYKSDPNRQHSPGDLAEIERLKMEERVIAKLMEGVQDGVTITVQNADGTQLQAQLFDIMDREKNFTGGGGHDHEFPDFYNILKNAYELYKKALQQGGVKNGINEVRTNAKIQEVYGGLFGGEGGTDFDSKIGNKTLGEILVGSGREHLIKGGLEYGIVNFREAGQALADELEAFGKANKQTHGSYIRMAEQIRKWVDETFTKDEIQKWLESFERSVQNLTIDFENMHNNIDLGRAMIANGTIGSFADITGIARPDLTRPQSQEQRENIGQLIAKYNEWAKETVGENGEKAPVFELGDMKNIKDVRDQIAYLNEQMEMNKGAFKALPQGEILTKALITALKDLDKTMRTEIAGINGRQFTGNGLNDAITNSLIDRNYAINGLVQKMRAEILHEGSVGTGDYKQFAESVKKGVDDVFKNFEKQLGKSLKRYPNGTVYDIAPYDIEAVKKKYDAAKGKLNLSPTMQGEMDQMWFQLEKQMKEFNASIGTGMIGYMRDFFHPEKEAARRYKALDDEETRIGERKIELEQIPLEERTEGELKELSDIGARLVQILSEKTEMGENGENIIPEIRNKGYENMMKDLGDWQGKLDKTKAAADALFGTIKSMTSALSKFYDMMNDGENPEWMQDMDWYMEDFMGDFEALVAPIVAVMGLIIALTVAVAVLGTTAGAVFGALIAAAAIAAAIFAVFQMHDRRLERQIEKLKDEVEELDAAMQHLQSIANRTVGFEKLRNEIAATGKELEKAALYAEMANKEKDKKNTDDDKVREYERSQQEALDAFEEGVRQMRDTLVKSTDDWASQMGSAIRQAFQNGENAARAFRDTVKTMIGDVIENMLQMAILEPLIESAIEAWTNSDYLKQKYTKTITGDDGITRKSFDQDNYLKELLQNIGDPDKAENFYQSMLMIGDTLIDTVNGMPSVLQDFYKYNSELGTLSGGIGSETEDTARRIEALENSKLGEIFAIRTMLQNYLEGSGFGDSMTADLQAAIASIASDTNLIRIATESILSRIDQMRNSNVQPLHVTIV